MKELSELVSGESGEDVSACSEGFSVLCKIPSSSSRAINVHNILPSKRQAPASRSCNPFEPGRATEKMEGSVKLGKQMGGLQPSLTQSRVDPLKSINVAQSGPYIPILWVKLS